MKVLVKFMTFIVIGVIVSICLIYLININIMSSEMNNASKIAIETCQNVTKSVIFDKSVGLDVDNYPIYDDESYEEYFITSFNNLVSNSDIYNLNVYCDYDKGLIAVHIHNNYSSLIKDKKLINIIEVIK